MQNAQASYPRVCTHEPQSFLTKLLESKGTGSEHLPRNLCNLNFYSMKKGCLEFNDQVCVKCLMPFFSISSKSPRIVCKEWVQTRGYQACVVYMPIPLRVCLAKAPTKHKAFLLNYAPKKRNAPFTNRNQILYNSSAGGRLRRPPCVTT